MSEVTRTTGNNPMGGSTSYTNGYNTGEGADALIDASKEKKLLEEKARFNDAETLEDLSRGDGINFTLVDTPQEEQTNSRKAADEFRRKASSGYSGRYSTDSRDTRTLHDVYRAAGTASSQTGGTNRSDGSGQHSDGTATGPSHSPGRRTGAGYGSYRGSYSSFANASANPEAANPQAQNSRAKNDATGKSGRPANSAANGPATAAGGATNSAAYAYSQGRGAGRPDANNSGLYGTGNGNTNGFNGYVGNGNGFAGGGRFSGASGGNGGGFGGNGSGKKPPKAGGVKAAKMITMPKKALAFLMILMLVAAAAAGFGGSLLAGKVTHSNTASNSNTGKISQTGYKLEDATGSNMSVQEINNKVNQSVVAITTESVTLGGWVGEYVTQGAGSGVIISEDGYIMTNNHVVEGARKIVVTINDQDYDATIIGTDAQNDVAVIKVDASGLTAATYGNSDQVAVGDLAVIIGNPLGELGGSVSAGIISATDRQVTLEDQQMTLIQTDASVNPGNSGGGMFNNNGQLVGLVVAKSSGEDVEGLGFAIPINTAAESASAIMKAKGDINTDSNDNSDNDIDDSNGGNNNGGNDNGGGWFNDGGGNDNDGIEDDDDWSDDGNGDIDDGDMDDGSEDGQFDDGTDNGGENGSNGFFGEYGDLFDYFFNH